MLSPFSSPTTGFQAEAMAFGSRMEAATEALLRIRNEVVTTLDRQVIELQQIHRALAYAPPPMTIVQDVPGPLITEMAPVQLMDRPSLFEHAPRVPTVPPAPVVRDVTPLQHVETAVATMEAGAVPFPETTLDPMLEQATLEELNDALASAFAMVASRSGG